MRSSPSGRLVRNPRQSPRSRLSFALTELGARARVLRGGRLVRVNGDWLRTRLSAAASGMAAAIADLRARATGYYRRVARAEAETSLWRRLVLAAVWLASRVNLAGSRLWQTTRTVVWPRARGRVSMAVATARARVARSDAWLFLRVDRSETVRRRLRFAVVVVISQMLLMALALAWIIHMSIIAVKGAVYFVEQNAAILWAEISASLLIIVFAGWVLAGQVRRLGERRRGDDERGGRRGGGRAGSRRSGGRRR